MKPDPLWREEFSIESEKERYVTRRQFSKFLVLTSLGMFVGNLWILVRSVFQTKPSYSEAFVARAADIPLNGVKVFTYPTPEDPCILVRTEAGFVAYSQKCTHLSCAVYYSRRTGAWNVPATADISQLKTDLCCKGRRPGHWPELCSRGADRNWSRFASKSGPRDDETIGYSAKSEFDGNRRRHGAHCVAAHYSVVAAFGYP